MPRLKRNRGFTLLELLLAMTLVALIVVLVYGSLRLGIRAWEKGEQSAERSQTTRIVLDLLRRQIVGICADLVPKAGEPGPLFGDRANLSLVSSVALVPGNDAGRVRVEYRIETADQLTGLTFTEKSLTLLPREPTTETEPGYPLLAATAGIDFTYLAPAPAATPDDSAPDRAWVDEWPAESTDLPLAVRIRVRETATDPPLAVIVPIRQGEEVSW